MRNSVASPGSKEALWREHVKCWQRSGVSQREYCECAGLALSTFQLWRRRLATASTACVEIVPVSLQRLERSSQPVAVLADGGRYRLEVLDGASADTLRMILGVLEERN